MCVFVCVRMRACVRVCEVFVSFFHWESQSAVQIEHGNSCICEAEILPPVPTHLMRFDDALEAPLRAHQLQRGY